MGDVEPERRVKDFEIVRLLGSGGMGSVYLAQPNGGGPQVALKLLAATDAAAEANFRRGAEAARLLDHPHIAKTYACEREGGAYYLVDEFIDGKNLRQILASIAGIDGPRAGFDFLWADHEEHATTGEGGAPGAAAGRFIASEPYLRRCAGIARDLASALDHAHRSGVIHRDIKPANLMIGRDCRAKIIDFGLARHRGDVTLSQTGQLVGTIDYMSPEHLRPDGRIDETSDVFSLGVVLYEALTLQNPHAAATPVQTIARITEGRIRPARWSNPAIPGALEAIVHRATALSRDERYSSAGAMATDLRRWLEGLPVAARPYRFGPTAREINEGRPHRVFIAASFHIFQTIIMMILSLGVGFHPSGDLFVGPLRFAMLAMLIGTGLAFLGLSGEVLAGRWVAGLLSAVASTVVAVYFAFVLAIAIHLGNYQPFMISILALVMATNSFAVVALISPASWRWLAACAALRRSYRRP